MPKIVTLGYRNLPKEKRLEILERDNRTCQDCGCNEQAKKLQVHHILSQRYGGDDESSNLITLCTKCHRKADQQTVTDAINKTQEWSDEFNEEREKLIRSFATYSSGNW